MALLALAGCAGPNIAPAKNAHQLQGVDNAAIASGGGVQVIAQTSKWPGDTDITGHVTPMRIKLSNNTSAPVLIRYEDFKLVAKDGTTYVAIPPRQIQGVVRKQEVGPVTPMFTYSGFMVAPYYGYAYPAVPVYDGPFPYDSAYYDTYYRYWRTVPLPTPEMLSRALPDGVLESGGRIDGYLYFQKVPKSEQLVQFQARIPSMGSVVATKQPAQGGGGQAAKAQQQPQTVVVRPASTIEIMIPFKVD